MRLDFWNFELILRSLKVTQDIFEHERDCFWPVSGGKSDDGYDVPRILDRWRNRDLDTRYESYSSYRPLKRQFLRMGTRT
jgi:hypothetical protein